jgi:hypothetical protein
MKTGPGIIANYIATHNIDRKEFVAWTRDMQVPEEELNHYDHRCLMRLEQFVEERDTCA